MIFDELVLVEGELARNFNLSFVGRRIAGVEARVGRYNEGGIIRDFLVFFGGRPLMLSVRGEFDTRILPGHFRGGLVRTF